MITYDFSKVAREAAKSVESGSSDRKEFKYKIVYPDVGKIKFRILFNPKSSLVSRLITRHNIDGKKVLCASTYTHRDDCPICKVLGDISNMGKSYPREYKPTTRAIFFAQFVSADYEVAGGNLKKGDIFLMMVPYTIYRKINQWIADFSSDSAIMSRVFGSHEYSVQVIERGSEPTDWTFRPDPNLTIESAKSDEEFYQMLESIDSLYEVLGFHEEITPEEVALMKTTAQGLVDSYISPSSAQPEGYTLPEPPREDKHEVINPTPVSSVKDEKKPEAEVPSDVPSCWGHYVSQDDESPENRSAKIRCKYCPVSVTCADASLPF